jgi:hypothetical protein
MMFFALSRQVGDTTVPGVLWENFRNSTGSFKLPLLALFTHHIMSILCQCTVGGQSDIPVEIYRLSNTVSHTFVYNPLGDFAYFNTKKKRLYHYQWIDGRLAVLDGKKVQRPCLLPAGLSVLIHERPADNQSSVESATAGQLLPCSICPQTTLPGELLLMYVDQPLYKHSSLPPGSTQLRSFKHALILPTASMTKAQYIQAIEALPWIPCHLHEMHVLPSTDGDAGESKGHGADDSEGTRSRENGATDLVTICGRDRFDELLLQMARERRLS